MRTTLFKIQQSIGFYTSKKRKKLRIALTAKNLLKSRKKIMHIRIEDGKLILLAATTELCRFRELEQ